MKNNQLKATLLALGLGLGMGLSSTAIAAFQPSEEQCEEAGYQCLQEDDQNACRFLFQYCLD